MVELGFHSTHFSPMFGGTAPLHETITASADAGFDLIGLDLMSVEGFMAPGRGAAGGGESAGGPESDGATLDDLAGMLESSSLRCSDVVVFAAGPTVAVSASAQRLATVALAVGSPLCIGAVSAMLPWPELCAQFGEAADVLAEHGVSLAIEFVPYSPLDRLETAMRLCNAVGWHRCGLVLDSLHWFRAGTPIDALRSLDAAQIALVQCSDAPLQPPADLADESRHHRLVPGFGELPLREWAESLLELGYDGVVSAEVLSDELRSRGPVVAASRCFGALSDLWR